MSTQQVSRLTLPTIALSLMTVVSAVAGLSLALPTIAVQIGASQTELTWIVDSYTVVFAGLLLIAGAIGFVLIFLMLWIMYGLKKALV